jgi:hypothetical protein
VRMFPPSPVCVFSLSLYDLMIENPLFPGRTGIVCRVSNPGKSIELNKPKGNSCLMAADFIPLNVKILFQRE